jgi:hypothetical protein
MSDDLPRYASKAPAPGQSMLDFFTGAKPEPTRRPAPAKRPDASAQMQDGAALFERPKSPDAKDYIFSIHSGNDVVPDVEVIVMMVERKFFEAYGFMEDSHLREIASSLPDDFDEMLEGTFGCPRGRDAVMRDLLDRGFRFSKDLFELIDGMQDMIGPEDFNPSP